MVRFVDAPVALPAGLLGDAPSALREHITLSFTAPAMRPDERFELMERDGVAAEVLHMPDAWQAPAVFEFVREERRSVVVVDDIPADQEDAVRRAAQSCPAGAIILAD